MELIVKENLKTIKIGKEEGKKEIKIYKAIAKFLTEKIKAGSVETVITEREQAYDIEVIVTKRIGVLEPEDAFKDLAKFVLKLEKLKEYLDKLYSFYSEHIEEIEGEKNEKT
ncbi:MAG: hypothetical protein J7L54_05530 [Elusimicrobia bacterium]|nr:hypothetical protein [Elusimicrobiota bacterium]